MWPSGGVCRNAYLLALLAYALPSGMAQLLGLVLSAGANEPAMVGGVGAQQVGSVGRLDHFGPGPVCAHCEQTANGKQTVCFGLSPDLFAFQFKLNVFIGAQVCQCMQLAKW